MSKNCMMCPGAFTPLAFVTHCMNHCENGLENLYYSSLTHHSQRSPGGPGPNTHDSVAVPAQAPQHVGTTTKSIGTGIALEGTQLGPPDTVTNVDAVLGDSTEDHVCRGQLAGGLQTKDPGEGITEGSSQNPSQTPSGGLLLGIVKVQSMHLESIS
jgi:hypothetical protein